MPLIVIAPVLGWSWVMLSPLIMAAAGALGYHRLTGKRPKDWLEKQIARDVKNLKKVQIPLDEVVGEVVAEELGREQRLDFQRDDIVITFRKDVHGKFFVEVTGPRTATKLDLLTKGDEFARTIVQQFAHHRIAKELDRRGVHIVAEETNEEGDIVLHTRKWG